jgi:poly(A) polymerase
MNIFEKEEETIRRYVFHPSPCLNFNDYSEGVLKRLNLLIREFVRQTIRKRHPDCNQYILDNAGGKIFTFGSYRLGAHSAGTLIIDDFHHHITLKPNAHFITYAGSDIDALCVVPKFVQREDFFTTFYEMLTLMKDEVSDVTAVPDSYVPVMKMSLDGIPIDLVFARLSVDSVPDDLELRDEHLLKTLDERCVRSLNGVFILVVVFLRTERLRI